MNLLKNILLFFLIVELTVPTDTLHFVVHMPNYLHHFYHHNKTHQYISVIDFINDHTINPNHHDKDHHNHDNLPFSHQHSNDNNQILAFIPFYSRYTINLHLTDSNDKRIIVQQFFRTSEFLPSIWQPPKMC